MHNVFDLWPLEDKSVQAIITSPPYFSLRRYEIPDVVIGGRLDCEHKWGDIVPPRGQSGWHTFEHKYHSPGSHNTTIGSKMKDTSINQNEGHGNFCIHCGAWKGQHGLEPTYQLYIEHVRLWAAEAFRVLRDDGIFFLNLGDSYGGSWGNYGARAGKQRTRGSEVFDRKGDLPNDLKPGTADSRAKCKLLIPHRVAIVLIDDGWRLRNDIVWNKPNAMPESCGDRFSKKFEYIFMFSKSQKYYFNLDAVREPHAWVDERGERIGGKSVGSVKKSKEWDKTMGGGGTSFRGHSGNYKSDGTPINNPKGKNPGDVWKYTTQPSPYKHYAMWPEQLVKRMILCSTRAGDTVLDPFIGSGTTLKVADQLQREGIGFDMGYKDIQDDRLTDIQRDMYV